METVAVTNAYVGRSASAISILLVGGQAIFRAGLRRVLDNEPDFIVAGEAANAVDATRALVNLRPDIVIVTMAGRALAQMLRATRAAAVRCGARTIVLASELEKARVAHAHDLGVSGLLSTATVPSVLIDSVRSVAAGTHSSSTTLDRPGTAKRQRVHSKNPFGLTKRELEVVEAVVRTYLINLN
jgi:DNA-binding NarL/FixJ family response regulator